MVSASRLICRRARVSPASLPGGLLGTVDFDDYATARTWLLSIDQPFVILKRALYRLSQKVGSSTRRTWDGYATAVMKEPNEVAT